ncbi:MAG: FMN-dependent NADH-azoreductase [Peptococcaceae bacterium]|nr:FMN-dependent NADH-azoreductase [Peptococcaceae bacterium]
MATLLYVKANPKSDQESRTFRISEAFINAYRKANPGDQMITHDLYAENIRPITAEQLQTRYTPKDESVRQHPIYKYAYEFKTSDKIVIAAPMWNLSFPAILKCYLDYIMAVGITFQYTENGPVGLCQGKKAVHIVTRGGVYSEGPAAAFEMGDKYLRVLFGFLGITDFTTIAAEKLDVIGTDVEGVIAEAIKKAENKGLNF